MNPYDHFYMRTNNFFYLSVFSNCLHEIQMASQYFEPFFNRGLIAFQIIDYYPNCCEAPDAMLRFTIMPPIDQEEGVIICGGGRDR